MKKTIAQKLKETKYKIPSNLEWGLFAFLARLPMLGPKYHVEEKIIDDPRDCKGPCFIIWNHQSRRDYLFLKNLIAPMKFNMVASYCEIFRLKFNFFFKRAHVIPKKPFVNDPTGIKAMMAIIKQGGCVAFSPEGSSSEYGTQRPIVTGTGKFLKFFNVPVYFMKLEGAYLTSHKVSIDDRVGKVKATMSLLFSKDDLMSLTGEEIDDKINDAFFHDDYAWNKTARIKYKTKGNACNRLDDIIYKCPKCGQEFCITAKKDKIYCEKCGNGGSLDDYYDFKPLKEDCKLPVSPAAWMDYQRINMINDIRNDPYYSFKIKVRLGELPKYKLIRDNNAFSIPCGSGELTFDHEGIHFEGIKNNEPWKFDLTYKVYYTISIESECDIISLYVNNDYYDFKPELKGAVGKVLLLVEEMHRLHVNTWKNFKQNAYMYHGTELEVEDDNFQERYDALFQ